MYFLKRNFKTIILYILAMGLIGTMIAYFLVGDTYDYEEYYSLSEPFSTTQEDELSIKLNQEINAQYEKRVASISYSAESQYLSLNVNEMPADDVSQIKNQFDSLLDEMGMEYEEGINTNIESTSNILMKVIIIAISIILGSFLGLMHSLQNRRIETDEDVKYYLNEKTLGTF